nr:superoxide dismutase [Effusibacillus pohliae]
MSNLQRKWADSDALKEQLDEWLRQFSWLRKQAEEQRNAERTGWFYTISPATHALLRQGTDMHAEFIRFLEKHMVRPHFQLVHGQNCHGQTRFAEQHAEAAYRPVPIGEHVLPPLPYEYDALEPHIDEKTMRIHHTKHHKSYVDGLNKAEKEMQKARETGDFNLIRHWEREAAFHGAGHYLHSIFWNNMKPHGGGPATGAIGQEIERTFGSFEKFKRHFTEAADKAEGVGWALLVWSPRSHRAEILQAEKHQLFSQQDQIPLLVLDVWEHAYYLKHQNNRRDYIGAWWNVVNWEDVNRRFEQARTIRWHPF